MVECLHSFFLSKYVIDFVFYIHSCITSQNATMEGFGSPTCGGNVHQNKTHDITEPLETEALYSYAVLSQTHHNNIHDSVNGTSIEGPATKQGSTVNRDVYSYEDVNNVKIEGVYTIVEDEIEIYSKLQRK